MCHSPKRHELHAPSHKAWHVSHSLPGVMCCDVLCCKMGRWILLQGRDARNGKSLLPAAPGPVEGQAECDLPLMCKKKGLRACSELLSERSACCLCIYTVKTCSTGSAIPIGDPCALRARSRSAMSLASLNVEDAHSRHMRVCSLRPY